MTWRAGSDIAVAARGRLDQPIWKEEWIKDVIEKRLRRVLAVIGLERQRAPEDLRERGDLPDALREEVNDDRDADVDEDPRDREDERDQEKKRRRDEEVDEAKDEVAGRQK